MNIAQALKSHYGTEDFGSDYVECMLESYDQEEWAKKITDIVSLQYSDFDGHALILTEEQSMGIAQYIFDNIDDFIQRYGWYYVGDSCIDAISFGEQEEQLSGLYNHKTGKEYSLKYLQKIFDEEGYYVSGDLAYWDLSSEGVYIDLFASEIPLLEELIEQYNKEARGYLQ